MPLLITPRTLTRRGEFYHQLSALTGAGVGLISAVEMLGKAPPDSSFRRPLGTLREQLHQGATFSNALRGLGRGWLPEFDIALIEAGEQSGRLDLCFRLLADYYHERARLVRQILSELGYPAFILHLAILIFPTGRLTRLVWQGDVLGFVLAKAAILLPLYAALLWFAYLGGAQRGERWRSALERLLQAVPVLGAARSHLALARLSIALESLLQAGVTIIEAWELAAAASGSPHIQRTVRRWKPDVLAGLTPAEAIRQSHAFPDLFTNLYNTGELSGQLDDTLQRLYRHYQEEATRKMHAFAQWAPRLVYFLILLLIAWQIIAFWSGYFSEIDKLSQ